MTSTIRRRTLVVLRCLCVASLVLTHGQSRPLAQSGDEAEVRALVERYFAAYAKEDLRAIAELWREGTPDFSAHRTTLERLFADNERIEVNSLSVRRLDLDGATARARVSLEVSAVEARTGKLAAGFGKQSRSFHFVKEAGVWKILREESGEDELASMLVAAKTEAERASLLGAHEELLTARLAERLAAQGKSFTDRSNYPAALAAYQLARTVAERVGDTKGVVAALNGTGDVQLARGDFAAALESFRQALKLAEAGGEEATLVTLQNNLCIAQARLGNYDLATEHCRRSLALAEAAGSKAAAANALNNLGIIARQRGNHEQALEFYRKSLALYEAAGDRRNVARLLNNLGVVHNAMGKATTALQYYLRSLPVAEEIGNKAGVAGTSNNISMIYRTLGNYKLALEYSQRSLALSEAIGDKLQVSFALEEIGKLHAQAGEHAQALESYRKSLALAEQTGLKIEIAIRLLSVGDGYRNLGDDGQAVEYYRRALATSESIGAPYTSVVCLLKLGQLHLRQGKNTEALEFAERAVAQARQLGTHKDFWQTLQVAGAAHRALKQPEQARRRLEEAIGVIETARSQLSAGERELASFFETRLDPYVQMVTLLAEQGRTAEAFGFAERAKARVLLDVLQAGRVDFSGAMTEREREQENRLRAELNSLNAQLRRESQAVGKGPSRVEELKAKLEKARLAYEGFRTQLYAAHPELRIKRGEAQPVALEQAGELLADGRTALLEYVVADDRTFLFVLTAEAAGRGGPREPVLRLYDLKLARKDLAARVQSLRQRIANNDLEYAAPSAELYDLLIAPARQQLGGKTRFVIVPDDVLWEAPFQALRPAGGKYLIQTASVSYAPSLTVLREMTRAKRDRVAAGTLLAMGNPQLAGQTVARSRNVLMSARLEPLPDAERMVKSLARIYGPAASRTYTGAEAREDVLKAEAGKHRILQLATHGVLNDASPMYSHVVLSQNEGEDGLLEAWEMMNLDLKADLVVLSACETARGRLGAGEGVIGMTWALFVAGSPATVVSQWKVESTSTTELMLEFHRSLHGGAGKAEALRRASLKLLADRRYGHPFYWAGFIVVGDAD